MNPKHKKKKKETKKNTHTQMCLTPRISLLEQDWSPKKYNLDIVDWLSQSARKK